MKKFVYQIALPLIVLIGIVVLPNLYLSDYFGSKKEGVKKEVVKNENWYNARFCDSVGGKMEVRHDYAYPSGDSYVKVDCETDTTVWEGGLDKPSSLDSIQQALFSASLSGKEPGVVIYDTDGKIGKHEYRIKEVCQLLGVTFLQK